MVAFIKLKSAKRQDPFRVCRFYIHSKAHTERCVLVTKKKLKPDVNIMSDLRRDQKYVDNNIHIFHLL